MTSTLFNSVFTNSTTTVDAGMLLIALLCSLLLGACLAWVYKYRTFYTREFVITLTILPSLIALIIFLVNGNLGTGVAVAGAFTLIRFRSATSGSRELLAIFLSMIIGIASGMGYLFLAITTTLLLLLVWFTLENLKIISESQTRRHLTLTVNNNQLIETQIEDLLSKSCTTCELVSINSQSSGGRLKFVYEIDLKPSITDFQFIQNCSSHLDNPHIVLTRKGKKKKNL